MSGPSNPSKVLSKVEDNLVSSVRDFLLIVREIQNPTVGEELVQARIKDMMTHIMDSRESLKAVIGEIADRFGEDGLSSLTKEKATIWNREVDFSQQMELEIQCIKLRALSESLKFISNSP